MTNNTQENWSKIIIKKNDLWFIYNPNIVKSNVLTEIHMKQILEHRNNINVQDLMLINNYYSSISFIWFLALLLIIRFNFLNKYNFIEKWNIEYDYYLIIFGFSSFVIFWVFLNMWKFTIFIELIIIWYFIYLYRKDLKDLLELLFANPKINIELDSSVEEEAQILYIDSLSSSELLKLNLSVYNRTSNRVIKRILTRFWNLFVEKFIGLLNILLLILMLLSLAYILYFLFLGYDVGLNKWLINK